MGEKKLEGERERERRRGPRSPTIDPTIGLVFGANGARLCSFHTMIGVTWSLLCKGNRAPRIGDRIALAPCHEIRTQISPSNVSYIALIGLGLQGCKQEITKDHLARKQINTEFTYLVKYLDTDAPWIINKVELLAKLLAKSS